MQIPCLSAEKFAEQHAFVSQEFLALFHQTSYGKNTMIAKNSNGFTAVELLVTLFIAVIFLIAGYTLYVTIIRDSGGALQQTQASNLAYDYMRRYAANATSPCTANPPLSSATPTASDNNPPNARVTVAITCPDSTRPTLSLVTVTVTYGTGEALTHAIYARPQ